MLNFLIIVGIVLAVIAIIIYVTLNLSGQRSNIDPTNNGRFIGGKLKGGGRAYEFAYIVFMLAVMCAMLWLLGTTMKHF